MGFLSIGREILIAPTRAGREFFFEVLDAAVGRVGLFNLVLEGLKKLRHHAINISTAHGDYEVARRGNFSGHCRCVIPILDVVHLSLIGKRVGNQYAGYARFGVFAGRINVEHNHLVAESQRLGEFGVHQARAAVEVRLKNGNQTPRANHGPSSLERCGNFGWVVGKVVSTGKATLVVVSSTSAGRVVVAATSVVVV